MGDADTEVVDATLRVLAARSAARRSIGVRGGPAAVTGTGFSDGICGVDSGSGAGVTEAELVSVFDDARGVSEGVGVMDSFFSVFTAVKATRGGADAGCGTGSGSGSGTLGRRSVVTAERAAFAAGRPADRRG